jgi:hypothetical protein
MVDIFGFEERDCGVGHPKIDQSKKPCSVLDVKVVGQGGGLSNLVPVILDLAAPEVPD